MRTKLQRLLFALFAVMVWTSVKAQTSGTCGYPNAADVQWSYDNGTLTFTGTGAMNMYNENQPDAPWWMTYMTDVTSVVIGEGITTIPHWAFAVYENLASVTLPSTLTTIGKSALEECAFTNIDLPEGLETIGDYAFQMTPLTSVTIPSTVTSIGEVAFQANDALTYVICLAATPPTMGDNVFQACSNLTAIFVPAAKVETYKAADGWSDYTTLIKPISGSCGANAIWSYSEGVMIISGSGAMADYSSSMTDIPWITNQEDITTVIIGDEITHVGNWAFQGCTKLRSVVIGEKVTSIGNGSFDNCTNDDFNKLNIPNSVQTIGIDAFSNNHLKYVCLGSGLTSIGAEAFMVCNDLQYIGCYASTPPTIGTDAFMGCSALATIYVPSAKIGDYTAASGWSDYAAMIQSPAGTCGTSATWSFEMATRTLTIEGTGAINDYTGWDSTSGDECFSFNPYNSKWYPYGIKNVVIGEGITEIPSSAFYMEVGITDVTLPSTLTAIGIDAFGECENIETITCEATNPPTLADAGNETSVFYANDANYNQIPITTITTINVPSASVSNYKAAAGWSEYTDKICGYDAVSPTNATSPTAHWTTYYNNANHMVADANTTVYQVSLSGTSLTLTEVPDRIINKGQGVIIKSTGTSIALQISASESATSYAGNSLIGTDTQITNPGNAYILNNGTSGLGFYKLSNAGTIKAHKAYLTYSAPAPEFFNINGNLTGIVAVQSDNERKTNNNAFYNLNGQRVAQPTKGLYIVNGKKVIIK